MKITESQLKQIIKESIVKVLNENNTKPNELINEDFNNDNLIRGFGGYVDNLMGAMNTFKKGLEYYRQLLQFHEKFLQRQQQLMQGGNQQQVQAQQSQQQPLQPNQGQTPQQRPTQ